MLLSIQGKDFLSTVAIVDPLTTTSRDVPHDLLGQRDQEHLQVLLNQMILNKRRGEDPRGAKIELQGFLKVTSMVSHLQGIISTVLEPRKRSNLMRGNKQQTQIGWELFLRTRLLLLQEGEEEVEGEEGGEDQLALESHMGRMVNVCTVDQ